MFTKEEIELAPEVCKVLKKLGWKEWKPEEGEWGIYEGKAHLITQVDGNWVMVKKLVWGFDEEWIEKSKVVPILHWEKIEEILEEFSYDISTEKTYENGVFVFHKAYISIRDEHDTWRDLAIERGKTRQEAVMRAVVELGKRIEKIGKKVYNPDPDLARYFISG